MTTDTNWPNPERPGVPMFPERDGKHVIDVDQEGSGSELVYYWIAEHQVWVEYDYEGPDDALEGYDLIGWAYVGPVLTPTQIAEMLAGERERCLAACESAKVPVDGWGGPIDDGDADRNEGIDDAMAAIRNLGAAS